MSHKERGGTTNKFGKLFAELVSRRRIKRGKRLVKQEERRLAHQGTCKRHALSLAAREFSWCTIRKGESVHTPERSGCRCTHRGGHTVRHLKWKGDIPCRTAPTEKSRILKGDSNIFSSSQSGCSSNQDFACVRLKKAGGQAQEGGLAAAICTKKCDALPRFERQRCAVKNSPRAIREGDAAKFEGTSHELRGGAARCTNR